MNNIAVHKPCLGAALIMVLVTLLALSGLVLKAAETTSVQSRDMSLLALEYRSDILARAGLRIALNLMLKDNQDETVLTQKAWTQNWQDRGLSIKITPCAARINLNGLATGGIGRARLEKAVLSILMDEGLSYYELEHLLYWIGTVQIPPGARGGNPFEEYYSRNDSGYTPPGRRLTRPEELLLVGGFEDLSPEWVRKWFTVWGEPVRIDINFASRETALAILPELEPYWNRIDSFRTASGITHPNQLLTEIGMDLSVYNTVLPFIILESQHFEIIVEIQEGSWYEKHRYIVSRNVLNPSTPPEIRVRDVLDSRLL